MSRLYKIEIFEPDEDGHVLHAYFEQRYPSSVNPRANNTAEVVIQLRDGWRDKTLAEIEAMARQDFAGVLRATAGTDSDPAT